MTERPWYVEVKQTKTHIESKNFRIASDVANEDAYVLAASPEMYDALKLIEPFLRQECGFGHDYWRTVARAIDKAEGRRG